jgi:hypothetical protein
MSKRLKRQARPFSGLPTFWSRVCRRVAPLNALHRSLPTCAVMFTTLNLFQTLRCPERSTCSRKNCLFSHAKDIPAPSTLIIPVRLDKEPGGDKSATSSNTTPKVTPTSAKRPAPSSPSPATSSAAEPPRKLQKVGTSSRSRPIPTSSEINVSETIAFQIMSLTSRLGEWCTCAQNQRLTIPSRSGHSSGRFLLFLLLLLCL